jgi:hypothetical protein
MSASLLLFVVLVIGAAIIAIVSAFKPVPLWIAVLLLAIAMVVFGFGGGGGEHFAVR